MNQLYIYKARIKRIIDGDSVVLDLDHGRKIWQEVYARLYGINAPEMRGEERSKGLEARYHLVEILKRHRIYNFNNDVNPEPTRNFYVETHKDKTGKYGRDLVTIYLDELDVWPPTHSANQQMIDDGFAVKY